MRKMGEPPVELRVHGVGGPQARKMLGCLNEEDLVTMPPLSFPDPNPNTPDRLPVDGESRFARPADDATTEAYEWGGLTTGSWKKALWILYLPFTIINAAGWAHRAAPEPDGRLQTTRQLHVTLVHAVALLATATYVLWIGYLLLDLVAVRWRNHVRASSEFNPGIGEDAVIAWLPVVAPVVFVGLLAALVFAPIRPGRFEEVGGADATRWPPVPRISDPNFFARRDAHRNRYLGHTVFGGLVAVGVFIQYAAGVHRLGALLFVLAGLQGIVLLALIVTDTVGRLRHSPIKAFPTYEESAIGVWQGGRRLPVGSAFAVGGTAMAHAAFAATAAFVVPLLADWPDKDRASVIDVGPQLLASDVLMSTLLLFVLGVVVTAIVVRSRGDDEVQQGVVVKLARRANFLGLLLLLAVVIPVTAYVFLNARHQDLTENWWTELLRWYDCYPRDEGSLVRRAGAFVLLLIPPAFFGILRGAHDSGLARVVGNIWDVLTFWPRRFHPMAAPPSAERAVPELRRRVEWALRKDGAAVLLVGHSQGSVLTAAAVTSATIGDGKTVYLVTFGSPLSSLYAPAWPSYLPPLLVDLRAGTGAGARWKNYWRATDPVGGAVDMATNEPRVDPRCPQPNELDDAHEWRPGERPVPWSEQAGHGRYLSDPVVRTKIGAWRDEVDPLAAT